MRSPIPAEEESSDSKEERNNLRIIQARTRSALTLEQMEERRMAEAIEIEEKLLELLRSINARRNR